jgi:hypothetical protein
MLGAAVQSPLQSKSDSAFATRLAIIDLLSAPCNILAKESCSDCHGRFRERAHRQILCAVPRSALDFSGPARDDFGDPMSRTGLLRSATLMLAFVHTFPAHTHLAAFLQTPTLADAWKGFGALLAIGLYLLPVGVQARGLAALWRRRSGLLGAGALLLVVVHAVPACDHVPRMLKSCTWADAWRGVGAMLAVAWFLAPLSLQARAVKALARLACVNLGADPSWRATRRSRPHDAHGSTA